MDTLTQLLDVASDLFFALMILATIIVRIIPGKKDDRKVYQWISNILRYCPTFWLNPNTKRLEEELKKRIKDV